MSVWGELRKKSLGQEQRLEYERFIWHKGTYEGSPSPDEKTILSKIHDFTGFAPFLPDDILEDKGDVKVYLDDKDKRKVTVTLAQLEEAQHSLEDEVRDLVELVNKLRNSPKADQREIEKLSKRIRKLEKRIEALKGIISRLRAAGKELYTFETSLLGYYARRGDPNNVDSLIIEYPENREEIPAIHLMMGNIGNDHLLLGIVFAHELMHAYFDMHDPYMKHPKCRAIEEPIAEYGMLCFMEMFERHYPEYEGIFKKAKALVDEKRDTPGLFHYGFGGYLYEDRAVFGVEWASLFQSSCVSLMMDAPNVCVLGTILSPIRYPRNERFCEWIFHDILRPKRFISKKNKTGWGHLGNPKKQELYFWLDDSMVSSIPFMAEYPSKTKVHLTFRDKTDTKQVSGFAGVQVLGRFRLYKTLMEQFAAIFGTKDRLFTFYEEKPSDGIHPAEWVAIELESSC